MSMAEIEKQRHASQRGDIIRVLCEDYRSTMTAVGNLSGTLDSLGTSISMESLCFHLTYLADSEFIKIWRTRDMPGWRTDRSNRGSADDIRFAKLLPRGLQLLDGICAADPGVKF